MLTALAVVRRPNLRHVMPSDPDADLRYEGTVRTENPLPRGAILSPRSPPVPGLFPPRHRRRTPERPWRNASRATTQEERTP